MSDEMKEWAWIVGSGIVAGVLEYKFHWWSWTVRTVQSVLLALGTVIGYLLALGLIAVVLGGVGGVAWNVAQAVNRV
jgi:hypothetical protein